MNGNTLSLGRNHTTADAVSLTTFSDCFRVNINWNDGAYIYAIYDTKQEALDHIHALGWS